MSTASPFLSVKPVGLFIQPLTVITISEPLKPAIATGIPERVHARRRPVPAVDVDADEDRLDEEREALEREREPEDVAEVGHPDRPEQPEPKLRIVPVTTPTAKREIITFDQRRASVR